MIYAFFLSKSIITEEDNKKLQNKLKGAKFIVQQEKNNRKQQPSRQNTLVPSNNRSISQLKDQLNQFSKRIQSLLADQNQNPDKSNNSQFQAIQEQLSALQDQIQEIEKNSKKPNSNSPDSQSEKQEITKLRSQLNSLQNDLNKKQEQTKENNQVNNTQSSNDKGFNWLYVVIPGGVLILAMAVIIAYLLGKRNKES